MTSKDDWAFRASFLREMAEYLETRSDQLKDEALRYRGLADQSEYLARNPDLLSPQVTETDNG